MGVKEQILLEMYENNFGYNFKFDLLTLLADLAEDEGDQDMVLAMRWMQKKKRRPDLLPLLKEEYVWNVINYDMSMYPSALNPHPLLLDRGKRIVLPRRECVCNLTYPSFDEAVRAIVPMVKDILGMVQK